VVAVHRYDPVIQTLALNAHPINRKNRLCLRWFPESSTFRATAEVDFMNAQDELGRSLLQRFLNYRNRAEQLRIMAQDMPERSALLMHTTAKTYDHMAETIRAILLQSAEQTS